MKPDAKKVLIVDDDLSLLEALQISVEMKGCDVKTVSSGDEVIPTVQSYNPDLILLDVLLSGWDGRDIARILRSREDTKDVPIIMLSASSKVEDIAKEVGANGFLTKPFELSDLWETIEQHTSR